MTEIQRTARVFTISGKRSLIPLALLAIGLVLITLQLISNVTGYVKALLTPVEFPLTYRFTVYDALLRNCVKDSLVDYKSLKQSGVLDKAVHELERINPGRLSTPEDRLAFWLNTYNLLVLKNVTDRYPIKSTRDLEHFMSLRKFVVGGVPYSVEDVERQEIRPLLKQGRPYALFLMCGGAMGYPALMDHAITAQGLEDDMKVAAYRFVNDPRNVCFDMDTNTFLISRLFNWYQDVFTQNNLSPFEAANGFLDPFKRIPVNNKHIVKAYLPQFNWWLNDLALKGMDVPRDDANPDIENLILEPSSQ